MVDNLVKSEWEEILKGLEAVPQRARGKAYQKAVEFVGRVLAGTNNLAAPIGPDEIHYSVPCSLCRNPIHILDDFVFKSLTQTYVHYDCSFRYPNRDA